MQWVEASSAPRVLLVDDAPSILAALRKVLARTMPQANVHAVLTAEAAIDALRARRFDAIVSDLRIGKGDGLEVLAVARAEQPHAVRILMTAFPEDANPVRVVNDAALDQVIEKPFHLRDFTQLLQKALDASRSEAEKRPAERAVPASGGSLGASAA